MNITKHALLWAGIVTPVLLATSCQDEDFGYSAEQIAYRSNFEKTFGDIASDQIWDFSTYNLTRLGLEGGPSAETTRASYTGGFKVPLVEGDASKVCQTLENHFELGTPMMYWLNENLTEKENHRDQGKDFLLSAPESGKDFLLIPIYQGHAGMEWELHFIASEHGGNSSSTYYDYKIWEKSQGVEYKIDYKTAPEFYFDHENTTTQFLEWRDGKRGGQLSFADAITLNNGETIGDGEVIVKFGLPAGKEVHGQFKIGDQLLTVLVNGEPTENFDFDNTQGSSFQTYEVVVGYCQDGEIKDFYVPEENAEDADPEPTDDKADNGPMLAPRRRANAAFNADGHDINLENLVWNFWNVSLESEGYPSLNSYEDATRIRIYTQFNYETDWIDADKSFQTGHTMDRAGVRAHPIQIKTNEISRNFLLYLKVTKGVDGYASTGACQRSDEGMMLALTQCNVLSENQERLNAFVDELVTEIPALDRGGKDAQYMVLGCEDANQNGSDWDINDVVFLLVGLPDAPDVKEQLVKKRYLIEDLGSTYDYDFNDIVIDVTQERILHPDGETSPKQTYAQLKHLCGTIPFRVQIGNTVLGANDSNPSGIFAGQNAECGEGGDGFDPVGVPGYKSITDRFYLGEDDWDPDRNNIIVTSWPSYAGAGTLTAEQIEKGWGNTDGDGSVLLHPMPETAGETYGFPEAGKFPYIIACDQTVMWMKEQYTVPRTWFKTWPKTYDDYLDNGGHSGDDPIVPDEDDPADTDNDKYITWDTEYNFGTMYWDFNAKLTPKRFANVNVGDIITIYYENANGAELQLDVIEPWTQIVQTGLAGGAGTYTFTVTEAWLPQLKTGGLSIKGVNYTFKKVTCAAPQYWEFTAGVADGCEGMGTVTYTPMKDSYLDGETVHVVAAPAEGYKFVSWSDGETFKSLERDVVITASTENIYATFAPAAKYSVKISAAEGGQISINGGAATTLYQVADVYEGTKIVVKAVPGSGYKFANWSDGDPQGATRTLYVYGDTEFSATFEETNEIILYNGSMHISNSSDQVVQGNTYSDQIVEGRTLKIYCDLPSSSWCHAFFGGQWNETGKVADIHKRAIDGVISIKLNDTNASLLKQDNGGLWLQSNDITITKVTLE